MSSHSRKSLQHETADSLTFIVSQFSSPNTPRKLLSEKKRDVANPDVLWRLKVYPNGNGTAGFLALYVDIPSKHSLPENWSCSRDITFTLHHPTDPSKSIFKHTSHTFNDEEPDWGYNQVIPIPQLSQRGFLLNDCIKVTATFRVHESGDEVSPSSQASLTPQTTVTPELTAPRSPSLPGAVLHEYNDREDCRVVIEEFSKAGCNPHACEWRSFSGESKFEWRLVVIPHSSSETVSAYIDVRAKDVNDSKWEQEVAAEVFLDNPENPSSALRYPFMKLFKACKPRKGFPTLSLTRILLKNGFLANDKLSVSATAKLVDKPNEKPKKAPNVTDAIAMQVHGFLSYDGSTPDSCKIVSTWHKLEGIGRWRFTVYPAGTKNNTGFVSAVVAFQPDEEWTNANSDWQFRVLCEAQAVRKGDAPEDKEEGDACVTILDAEHLKVSLDRVISMQKVIEHKDEYLKWDPTFEDDDTLRIRVLFRVCGPSGPKTFVVKQSMDACLKGVEDGVNSVKEALARISKPELVDVTQSATSWNTNMKELEEVFKKHLDVLASLGSELEYQDRIEFLNRKLAALKEEEEVCAGKGCPVEELNAKEQEMRSTLKKLLLLQTTGCEGNKPDNAGEDSQKDDKQKEAEEELAREVPKPNVSVSEVMARNTALVHSVYSLVEQCERVGALSSTLCTIRDGLEQYMTQMQQWIADQRKKHEEFVAKEKELEAQCKEAERKNQILRGDESVLKTLTMEEVTRYVDFVMEAVGQVAVAKYLTKK